MPINLRGGEEFTNMKLSEVFDKYRDEYMTIQNQSLETQEKHEIYKRSICAFFEDKDIKKLTLEDVHRWHAFLSCNRGHNTVRNYICKLRVVLKYAQSRGIKCLDYRQIPSPKREDTNAVWCTPQEVQAMINTSKSPRTKFVISLLYSSGIRLSELISLNRGDIRNNKFYVIGKGSKARPCYIDNRTAKLMLQYLNTRDDCDKAMLVSRIYKKRMTRTNVQLLVKNAAKRAGIQKNVTPHSLRHSCLTNLLSNGMGIRYVQAIAGHANIQTTCHYTHYENGDLEKRYREAHSI